MSSRKKRNKRRTRNAKHNRLQKRASLEQLEAKQLLDAGGFSELIQAASFENDALEVEFSTESNAIDSSRSQSTSSEVIFVDAGVEDSQSMLAEMNSDAEVIFLDADSDGIEQISNALAGRTDISAIHIISHGDEGEVHLGNTVITSENLAQYEAALNGWSSALTEDADILFYGCELAGNHDGEQFIESISEMTGADVAASDDLTGAEALGGDWDLEKSVGTVETTTLEALSFAGVLGDKDGDGIDDADDLDDDNDGILDTEEGFVPATTTAIVTAGLNTPGFPTNTDLTVGDTATLNGLFGGLIDFEATLIDGPGGTNPQWVGGVRIVSEPTLGGDSFFVQPNGTGLPGDSAQYTFDFNSPVQNLSFLSGGINNGDTLIYEAFFQGVSVPITAADFSNLTDGVVVQNGNELFNAVGAGGVAIGDNTAVLTIGSTIDQLVVTAGKVAGGTGNVTLGFATFTGDAITTPASFRDTDGDGIADHCDLDSDDDGISDLEESGADPSVVDTDGDGVYDGTTGPGAAVDANGVPTAAGGGVAPVDSDNDGVDDYLDLDSDDDGIPDVVESQPTGTYTPPTGTDSDGDGIDDAYDTTTGHGGDFTAPEDTDGDGDPDYLDTDSDNDGIDDTTESGLTPGADNNGDGIGDGVNASYSDPDGIVNDPTTDLDNETGDTSEVGYREVGALPTPLPPLIPGACGGVLHESYLLDGLGIGTEQNYELASGSATHDPDVFFGIAGAEHGYTKNADGSIDYFFDGEAPVSVTSGDISGGGVFVVPQDSSVSGGAADQTDAAEFHRIAIRTDGVPGQSYTFTMDNGNAHEFLHWWAEDSSGAVLDSSLGTPNSANGWLYGTGANASTSGPNPINAVGTSTISYTIPPTNTDGIVILRVLMLDPQAGHGNLEFIGAPECNHPVSLEKEATAVVPASSGTAGNFDATYEFVIENTGNLTLDNLTLTEDFASHFGGAFVAVVGTPTITAGAGAVAPTGNAAYDGGAGNANVFNGTTGEIEVGETITVEITVEIDPDSATAIYNAAGELENQATTTGDDPAGTTVADTSDDPTDVTDADGDPADPTDDNGEPDDPTTLAIASVDLTKEATSSVPATSGTANNFDVTYEFVLTNDGSATLDNLRMFEDLATHFGGAFVGLVGTPTITAGPGAVAPTGSASYDGGTTDGQVFDIISGEIDPGEFVTVTIVVEIDPDNPTAVYNANGDLENSAVGAGLDEGGDVSEDTSDDPTNATDADPNGDNNPDDPTIVSFSAIDITKESTNAVAASSGTSGNFDVTYEFVITNTANLTLDNLTLTEDFATQFGGAFVGVIGTPTITAGTGAVAPAGNAGYNGGANANVFNGTSGEIEAGETITVEITVEIDPDSPTAVYNAAGELENQATTSGLAPDGIPATDTSDDPTDATNVDPNSDGNPDDPTALILPAVNTEKAISTFAAAASGTAGNFDVTYDITLTNTGNATVDNLTLLEDFAAQFGGAFVGSSVRQPLSLERELSRQHSAVATTEVLATVNCSTRHRVKSK